jgi:hypothetical protein
MVVKDWQWMANWKVIEHRNRAALLPLLRELSWQSDPAVVEDENTVQTA